MEKELPPVHQINFQDQLRMHLDSLNAAGILFLPRQSTEHLPVVVTEDEQHALPPLVAIAATVAARRHELDLLEEEVARCNRCPELFATRTRTVFGIGPLDAELAFVGEAPGKEEEELGEPFAAESGQLLNRIINACGLSREQVYLLNIIKCRPPRSRAPRTVECENCSGYLHRQLELVRPRHVVALGLVASRMLTARASSIGELRGRLRAYRGIPLICTHHPAEIEADGKGIKKRETWNDLKLLLAHMGRPV